MDFPKTRLLSAKQLIRQIVETNQNGGRFCFILGSGASAESGIPSGNTLEKIWMDCIMGKHPDGNVPLMDREESLAMARNLYEAQEIEHDPAQIVAAWESGRPMPSDYYFDIYKLRFHPTPRNGYRYLERLMEKSEPSIGYHVLALMLTDQFRNNLVITTNFDNLAEDALFLYTDKRPLVVSHESLACFIEPDVQRPVIAKLHRGLMYAPFNSPAATSGLRREWQDTLREALRTYTPIVIGYGGGDHSLMDFLSDPGTTMDRGIFWCYRKNGAPPNENVLRLLREKNGCLVAIDGFDALMLAIGKVRYESQIIPSGAEATLKQQFDRRVNQYNEQWERLNRAPELKPVLEPLNEGEQQAAQQRARTDSMTAWDHIRAGNQQADQGNHQEAIAAYHKALELDPGLAAAYYNLGCMYADLGQHKEAIASYSEAIRLDPANAHAFNNMGNAYADLGNHDEAIAHFTKAIGLDPADAAVYFNRGNSYARLGQQTDAIADYTESIRLDPTNARAHNNRGNSYAKLGQYREAIADFTIAIGLDPADAAAYYNRGNSYANLGQHAEAIADYTEAIRLDPSLALAYCNRGSSYADLGQHAEAIADYTQAITLNPALSTAYNNRGYAYCLLGQYYDAIIDCDQAIVLDPSDANAYHSRATAYYGLENYTSALADFCEAIRLDPGMKEAYLDRAKVHRAMGNEELAQADEAQAAQL